VNNNRELNMQHGLSCAKPRLNHHYAKWLIIEEILALWNRMC
jgi:hypothetical protein